jgi:hypothetical protein
MPVNPELLAQALMQARQSALPRGQIEEGNIDLFNRPQVRNPDGSVSTVFSMSQSDGQHEVLIPRVSPDGRMLSPQEAWQNYLQTGQHLGKFTSPKHATEYAQALHRQQENLK